MKRNLNNSTALLIAFSVMASALPVFAHADEVKKTDTATTTDDGDVIVTALRRNSTIQKTPLSIAAITGENIQKMGATGLKDYFRSIPNLNLTEGQMGSTRISIRGISAAGEATVGLYLDETPITGPSGTTQDAGSSSADMNLFDIQRVEVLRGPQGTLYGSSSMAGAIKLIYNKPDATKIEGMFEGQAAATDGGDDSYFAKAMVNYPIIKDKLAFRAVGWYEEKGGYIDNVALGTKNVNDSTSQGGRFMLGFTPQDNMSLNATYIYQKTEGDNQVQWFERLGDYQTDSPVNVPFNTTMNLYNLTYNYKLPKVNFTATASHYKFEILKTYDYTSVVQYYSQSASACKSYYSVSSCSTDQMTTFSNQGLAMLPAMLYQPASLVTDSFEARATSSLDGPLQFTVGAYLEHRKDHIDSNTVSADAETGDVYLPLEYISYRYVETDVKQQALFGEVTYNPIDPLTIAVGLRYYDYDKVTSGASVISSVYSGSANRPYSEVEASEAGVLQKYNISYRFNPRLMAYVSASQGFRPGGANNISGLSDDLVVYDSDSLWNYEAGMKSSWFRNKLTFNASVYQTDWDNMQISATTADGAHSFITNAGSARIKGAEVEFILRPITGLTLNASAGLIDAKLTEDQANNSIQVTNSTGLKGNKIPGVPDKTAAFTVSYTWPWFADYDGLVRADYTYTGKMQSTFRTDNKYYEEYGDYSLVNMKVGIENDKYSLSLFVNNVANEAVIASASSSSAVERGVFSAAPRTIGVNVRAKF